MTDPEHVDPSQLRRGPIRRELLPPKLLTIVRSVYDVIGPYLDTTQEQFECGFMRDSQPENEVTLWCDITTAWIDYHEKFLNEELLPEEEEKKVLAALIAISTGVEDVEKLGVPVKVGRRLLACFGRKSDS